MRCSISANLFLIVFTFSCSWFFVNCMFFLKSNTSFLISLICCLVIKKFPLIRFDKFFYCWANSSLNTFLINNVKRFSSLSLLFCPPCCCRGLQLGLLKVKFAVILKICKLNAVKACFG